MDGWISHRYIKTPDTTVSDQCSLWFLNIHHVLADAWAHSLIFELVSDLYQLALRDELPSSLDIPPFQNFVDSERRYRSSTRYTIDETFWKHTLEQDFRPLSFYGYPPKKRSTHIERISCTLGNERTQKLIRLARRDDWRVGGSAVDGLTSKP